MTFVCLCHGPSILLLNTEACFTHCHLRGSKVTHIQSMESLSPFAIYPGDGDIMKLSFSRTFFLQCEDGAAVDSWRHLQDHLFSDQPKPSSVLGVRFGPDPHRCGHPAPGPAVQPGHASQVRLNPAVPLDFLMNSFKTLTEMSAEAKNQSNSKQRHSKYSVSYKVANLFTSVPKIHYCFCKCNHEQTFLASSIKHLHITGNAFFHWHQTCTGIYSLNGEFTALMMLSVCVCEYSMCVHAECFAVLVGVSVKPKSIFAVGVQSQVKAWEYSE